MGVCGRIVFVIPNGARNLEMVESIGKEAFRRITTHELSHINIRNKMLKSKYFINKLSTFYIVYVLLPNLNS